LGGTVRLYQTRYGVLVHAEVAGLPSGAGACAGKVFGFHIHEGDACRGNREDPFADAKGHYNPHGCEHPAHAGDLPPLFGNNGYALSVFLTDRFTVDEVIGRTVIIHGGVDDFTSQPAGNAGAKIACGRIMRYVR
jgi:Cu-Zn family superoxide dismutase